MAASVKPSLLRLDDAYVSRRRGEASCAPRPDGIAFTKGRAPAHVEIHRSHFCRGKLGRSWLVFGTTAETLYFLHSLGPSPPTLWRIHHWCSGRVLRRGYRRARNGDCFVMNGFCGGLTTFSTFSAEVSGS